MIHALLSCFRRENPTLRQKFLREAEEYLERELSRDPRWPRRALSGRARICPASGRIRASPSGG